MKKVKLKILSFMLCLIMCFSMIGCGSSKSSGNPGGDNTGGGNSGGGEPELKVTAQEVLQAVKNTFITEKDCEIVVVSNFKGQEETKFTTQIKIEDTYFYMCKLNEIQRDESESEDDDESEYDGPSQADTYKGEMITFENKNNSIELKLYDNDEMSYEIFSDVSKENYYNYTLNFFAIYDWKELYDIQLKNDYSTILISQNGSNEDSYRIVFNSEKSGLKYKITLNISNNYLNSTKYEVYNINNETGEEVFLQSYTANYDYSKTVEFNMNDYKLHVPEVEEDETMEILRKVYKSFLEEQGFSTNVYKLNESEKVNEKTNLVKVDEFTQFIKQGDSDNIINFSIEPIYREYNLTDMTYTKKDITTDELYDCYYIAFSLINFVNYTYHLEKTYGYEYKDEVKKLEGSDYEFEIDISFYKDSLDAEFGFKLFVKDNKLMKLEYILGTEQTIYVEYNYDVDISEFEINHYDFTLKEE